MSEILFWIMAVICVEAIVEIEVNSDLFAGIRDRIAKIKGLPGWYLNGLFSCGYCLSVWVSAVIALFIPTKIIPSAGSLFDMPTVIVGIANYLLIVFVLHRLSNIWHEVVYRWIERLPYIISIRSSSEEEEVFNTSDLLGGSDGGHELGEERNPYKF